MPTPITILATTPTPVIHLRSRRVHFPVRHALRLVPIPPVAALAHIPRRLDHLLLCPDGMAAGVVPGAGGGVAGGVALLVVERVGGRDAGAEAFDVDADVDADGLAAGLAGLGAV